MNGGVFQSSPVQQQVMGGGSGWWNLPNIRPPSQENPSSISPLLQLPVASTPYPMAPWHDNQEQLPPESLSQMLLGGLVGEEERCSFSALLQPKKLENWEEQMMFQQPTSGGNIVEVKQECSGGSGYAYRNSCEEIQVNKSRWNHQLPPVPSSPCVTSPTSCITSFNSNMLDFSSSKVDGRHPKPELSPECNSTVTGSALKKARVQGSSSSSSSAQSTFKVRKEKLGDRITALHQLVSPFGKTDTASVLLEAIGYIRFLQNQIEALSSPYLGNAPSSARLSSGHGERGCIFPEDPGQLLNDACMKSQRASEHDQKDAENIPEKDLRSRGLCLVPVSCTMHMDNDNSADFWAPTIGGTFR